MSVALPMRINCQNLIRSALVLLCLAAAGRAAGSEGKPLEILCSFYPMYVMALNVAGDIPGVSVECMTQPMAGCLHDYQLAPADLKALGKADIFIANGAGMETFITKAVEQSPRLKVIEASRGMKLGGTVVTVGFPNIGLQGFAPKFARGEIASLSGAADDARYFQISVPVQPGNSGGALVDEHGNVVGVVSAKLDAATALAASGALPENVNYAVKSREGRVPPRP